MTNNRGGGSVERSTTPPGIPTGGSTDSGTAQDSCLIKDPRSEGVQGRTRAYPNYMLLLWWVRRGGGGALHRSTTPIVGHWVVV